MMVSRKTYEIFIIIYNVSAGTQIIEINLLLDASISLRYLYNILFYEINSDSLPGFVNQFKIWQMRQISFGFVMFYNILHKNI